MQAKLAEAWQAVADARAAYPSATLADLYDPDAMPSVLLNAHNALDEVVDRAFGAKRRLPSNTDRIALLLSRYEQVMAADQLPLPKPRRRIPR